MRLFAHSRQGLFPQAQPVQILGQGRRRSAAASVTCWSSSSTPAAAAAAGGERSPSSAAVESSPAARLLTMLGRQLIAVLAAGALALPLAVVPAAPAGAVTEEQLLFLEAWRAVDRAYVDKGFNGQAWFRVRGGER